MDVTFPDEISFPLRQRLTLHGAVADRALPVPAVAEDTWELVEDRHEFTVEANGSEWEENAPRFTGVERVEQILALDAGLPEHDDELTAPEPGTAFEEVDPPSTRRP